MTNTDLPENQHSATLLWVSQGLLFLSFLAYFFCLLLPAYNFEEGDQPSTSMSGIAVLFWGVFSVLADGHVYWLANPLLWITWVMYFGRAHKTGAFFGVVSVLFAGSFLIADQVLVGCFDSCNYSTYYLKPGYYCWLASTVLATSAIIFYALHNANVRTDNTG